MAAMDHPGSLDESRRYDALLEIADLMVLHLSLPDLLVALSERLHKVASFELAHFSLHDSKDNVMRVHMWEGRDLKALPDVWNVEESVGGWVWKHQEAVVITDVQTERRFERVREELEQRSIRSYCVLPLTTAQNRFGGLGIGARQANAYQEADFRLLSRVSKLVALALESSFNRETLHKEKAGLQTLLEVHTTLTSSLDLQRLFPLISSALRRVVRHDYVSLALQDRRSQALKLYSLGHNSHSMVAESEATRSCPAYKAFEEHRIKVFHRKNLPGDHNDFDTMMAEQGIKFLSCIPLLTASGALGTLNVGSESETGFDETELRILKQVASQLAVALDNAQAYREIQELKDKLAKEKLYLEDEIRTELNFEEIVGESATLRRALAQAKTVAPSGATVLILGETGTGKELLARAIHRMSTRKDNSFIKLNCAAIPTGLLESELFGHEKGAFTGAINQKVGRLELADKGTLFLDEIGDIPLELQPKLLRVLQDQEFERLGGTRTIRVNVRLVAATNRDLLKLVADHEFRSDLYYRLNVFPIVMPPLRERGNDMPQLVRYFVQKLARRMDKKIETIPTATMRAFAEWGWPGNVRELENFIERSVILTEGSVLRAPLAELRAAEQQTESEGTLVEVERRHIIRTLKETHGVIAGDRGAAARLGLKRTTLQSRMQKLNINRRDYLI